MVYTEEEDSYDPNLFQTVWNAGVFNIVNDSWEIEKLKCRTFDFVALLPG